MFITPPFELDKTFHALSTSLNAGNTLSVFFLLEYAVHCLSMIN